MSPKGNRVLTRMWFYVAVLLLVAAVRKPVGARAC
jgi:hypothetical protein